MRDPADLANAFLDLTKRYFRSGGVQAVDDRQKRKQNHCDQHQEPVDRCQTDDGEDHQGDDTNAEWEWVDDFA